MEWNPSHIAMPPEPLQDEYNRTDCKDGNRDLINRRTTVADLRMIQSTNFPRGLGMEIHIRTTARHDYNFIDGKTAYFCWIPATILYGTSLFLTDSYLAFFFFLLSDVALKIGDDILQVSSNGKYMINGVHQASLPAKMAGLFHVTHTKIHGQRHEFYIEIAESEFLVISTFGEM